MGTATASAADSGPLSRARTAGAEAAVNDDESLLQNTNSAVLVSVAEAPDRAANLAAGAVMLLITLMMVLLAALVGGEFAAAIPSDSTFSDAINTTTDNAGTAFVIFGVSLLAIPTVSVLAYIVLKLGPFIGFSGMGGGGLMNRR